MVTAASTSDLAVILIDAAKGVTEQTKRHTYISSLLNISNIIVCINKMDLIGYSQDKFEMISNDFENFAKGLNNLKIQYIPVSALHGDNIVNESKNMKWYDQPSLLQVLEKINIHDSQSEQKTFRFPVQYIIRPMRNEQQNFRGYAGRIIGGKIRIGDEVTILPSGHQSKIKSIETGTISVEEAFDRMSVCITLTDEIDVSRGDMIAHDQKEIRMSQDIELMICWLSDKKLQPNGKYLLKHTTKEVRCVIKSIDHKVDIHTLEEDENDKAIGLNDIARISIKTSSVLTFDDYQKNKETGSLILIDESTFITVGAGMII
jgi:sulfate adenylyltransferase subunit 1